MGKIKEKSKLKSNIKKTTTQKISHPITPRCSAQLPLFPHPHSKKSKK